MTLKAVADVLRANGMSIRKVEGEYQVYPKGRPSQAYFTNDIKDALGTGLDLARVNGTLVGPDGSLLTSKRFAGGSRDAVVVEAIRQHTMRAEFTTGHLLPEAIAKDAVNDDIVIKSLGQLNDLLYTLGLSQGWKVVRSSAGYYYMIHASHAPSAGIYVYSCKGTTLGYWRKALTEVIDVKVGQ